MEKEDIILDIINRINNGDTSWIESTFGGFENAIKYIQRKGYLSYIDPFQVPDEIKNKLIFGMLNNEETKLETYKKLIDRLSDVREENGQYYLVIGHLEDLAELFKEYSRETSPHDIAKGVLGEDFWEPFNFWGDIDVYDNVIGELNPENKNYLKSYILDKLKDIKIDITNQTSEEMGLIASEQGHDDYMVVNSENVDRIIDDEDSMEYFLDNELDELDSDLRSLYSNSYNSTYESEMSEKVWDELYTYIDSDTKIEDVKWGNTYLRKLKITKHIYSVIYDWFQEYQNYNDDFDYQGSYLGIINQLMDEIDKYSKLSFRIPDYPWGVEKTMNDMFGDYI